MCLVALASLCSAQNEPVFRSGTRLVQVNVVVHGKSGPATGLTKDDFKLLEDGKPRTISVFSVIEAHANSPLPQSPQRQSDPGMISNRSDARGETPTTATVLLIDRLNTPVTDQPFTNAKVIEFLQKHGNGQRLGIYTLGSDVRVIQELTSDPERLLRAVARIRPQDAKRMASDVTMDATGEPLTDMMAAHALTDLQDFATADRAGITRSALEAIARHLAKVPGRKNLIWISASFPIIVIRPNYVLDYSHDVDRAARLLTEANIAVYPVDPRGVSATVGGIGDAEDGPGSKCGRGPCRIIAPPDPAKAPDSGLDTMNTLAALTGGRAFYHDNGIAESIQKAIEDAEVTYTLGFYPPDDAFDGGFHKLTVKVNRRGLDVRSRSGYFASKAGLDSAASRPTLTQLLDDSLDATVIGLRANAVPDASQTGSWVVRAIIDLHDLELSHENGRATGDVDVSFFVDDARSVRTITHKIDLSEAQFAAALDAGITVDNSIPADAKAREIRIVVQDHATGAAGSVRVPIRR
jgi:VWFA-related protein